MKINLTQTLEKLIENKVSSGLYNSADEVISDALRIFFKRETVQVLREQSLNDEIDKGLNNFYKNMTNEASALDDMMKKYE